MKIELCDKCGKYKDVCKCPAPDSSKCIAPKKVYGPARLTQCGKPAFYIWSPSKRPQVKQPMCRECGEMTAGNFTHELTPISNAPEGKKKE